MTRRAARLAVAVVLLAASGAALADVIRIPVGSQPAASDLPLPAHGTGRSEVLAHWGEPRQRHAPVGQPPIERWDYATFSVYFENDTVLHAVVKPPAHHPDADPNGGTAPETATESTAD